MFSFGTFINVLTSLFVSFIRMSGRGRGRGRRGRPGRQEVPVLEEIPAV